MKYTSLFILLALSQFVSVEVINAAPGTYPNSASITGTVTDKDANTPLPHVQVFIESLQLGDVSDLHGAFHIKNIPPGNYRLTFSLLGYETRTKKLELAANLRLQLNVALAPKIIELDNLVITATRAPKSTADVSQLVSVVTPKKLRERHLQQTPELLREEVGVFVQKTNQGGGSPIIRGFKANKLLLLVDGIRLNNATYRGGNTQYLSTVNSDALARIEIVHGPVSVLYGSDALGGAINVFTQMPRLTDGAKFRFNGSAEGSVSTADDTETAHLSLSGTNRRFGLLVDVSFKSFCDIERGRNGGDTLMQRLRNDSRTARILNVKQAPNAYNTYDFSSKVVIKLAEQQQLTLAYQRNLQKDVPRYDVVETRKDSIRLFDPQQRDLIYARYSDNTPRKLFNSLTATLSFHRQFERRIRQKFGSTLRTTDQFRTWTTGMQLELAKLITAKHHLIYGAELYYDDVNTRSSQLDLTGKRETATAPLFPDGSSFLNFGVFAQDVFNLTHRWRLTAGVRFSVAKLEAPFEDDPNSDDAFGNVAQTSSALTGSFGSQLALSEAINFVTNIAQGFRTPNLDDATKLGPGKGSSFFDIPNPDIDPEKSISFDAGFKIQSQKIRADIFGFYNFIDDLLVRRPAEFNGSPFIVDGGDTLSVFHKENAGEAYTAGFSASAEVQVTGNLALFGNLSYTYGQNTSDDDPLTGIPPLNGLAGLRWRHSSYRVELNTRFAVEQDRLALEDKADLRIPEGGTPGWLTLNLRLAIEVSRNISLKFTAANLLDRNYREHLSGFNAPGRNYVLAARVSR